MGFKSSKATQNPLHKQMPKNADDLKNNVKNGIGFLSGLSTHPDVQKYTNIAQNVYGHLKQGYDNIKGAYDHIQKNKDNYQSQANDLIDKGSAFIKPFVNAYHAVRS